MTYYFVDFTDLSPEHCSYDCKMAAFHIHFLVALYVILRKILFKFIIQLMVAWNCTVLCISTISTLQKIFTSLQNKQ
jgi:multisubunit Na+/H+ antiporter MnhC subunit